MNETQVSKWLMKVDYKSIKEKYEAHVNTSGDGYMVATFDSFAEAKAALPYPRFKFMKAASIERKYGMRDTTEASTSSADDFFKIAFGVRVNGIYDFWFSAKLKMICDDGSIHLSVSENGNLNWYQPVCAGPDCSRGSTKTCSRCRKVKYCCVECQRQHWSEHKKTCVAVDF